MINSCKRAPKGAPLKFINMAVYAGIQSDCIIWPFGTDSYGYGSIKYRDRTWPAHRLGLYLLTLDVKGLDPKFHAAHGPCNNPLCVNPHHLSWKSGKQNQNDRVRDGTSNRGEKQWLSKIKERDVPAIRKDDRFHHHIARDYGVSASTISVIKSGKTWSWVPRD